MSVLSDFAPPNKQTTIKTQIYLQHHSPLRQCCLHTPTCSAACGPAWLPCPARAALYKCRVCRSGNKLSLTGGKQVFYRMEASLDWPQPAQTLAERCFKTPTEEKLSRQSHMRREDPFVWTVRVNCESAQLSVCIAIFSPLSRSPLSSSLSPLPLSLLMGGAQRCSSLYKKCWAFNKGFYTATQEKRNDLLWSRSKMLDGHLLLGWLSFTVIVYLLNLPGPTAAYFG